MKSPITGKKTPAIVAKKAISARMERLVTGPMTRPAIHIRMVPDKNNRPQMLVSEKTRFDSLVRRSEENNTGRATQAEFIVTFLPSNEDSIAGRR